MTMQNRPGRPAPRQAVPGQKTTRSVPTVKPGAARPATASVPRTQPGTSRVPAQSRSGAVRGGAAPQQRKSNTPIIIGAAGGGLLLIIVLAVAMSGGGGEKATKTTKAEKAPPKNAPVDVSGLEREGIRQCDEGLRIIKNCEGLMSKGNLSAAESASLKSELEKGVGCITKGMGSLDQANVKSNGERTYNVTDYVSAKKAARMKLGELGAR